MALNERYIVASDLEQYFVDKDTGLPLAAGTLTFYKDNARNVQKDVFQLSGFPPNYTYTSMGSRITLSGVGTVQNSAGDNEVIYYYPFDQDGNLELYYVVCESAGSIQQFTREAWPNITAGNDPTKNQNSINNQISNPTFTNIFLNEGIPTTFNVTSAINQVFPLAPNWDLVVSGTGSVVVERISVAGLEDVPTSPPYVVDLQISFGITQCLVRQRFNINSGLWSSTSIQPVFLSGSIVARSESVSPVGIQMFYEESTGAGPILILDASFESTYEFISGSTTDAIPQSSNTDSGTNGYVDVYLSFTAGSHLRFSAVQVLPTENSEVPIISYDRNSSNREEALQGDYYLPRAIKKNMDSLLTGWDFQKNPFQFGTSGNVNTAAAYICDQTIAARGIAGNVTFAKDGMTGGLKFVTTATNDAFYVLQYLDGSQAKAILGNKLSVNIFGYQGSAGTTSLVRTYLFRAPSTAVFPTLPTTIGTIASSGVFTLTAANWTQIPRSGLDTPQSNLGRVFLDSDINDIVDIGFVGWELTDVAQIADTDKFAIVTTFQYFDANTAITMNSISCCPGDLPSRPSEKTFDQTLLECEFYFEKSYNNNIITSTINSSAGSQTAPQLVAASAGNSVLKGSQFGIIYNTIKRDPNLHSSNIFIFSPISGLSATVRGFIYSGGAPIAEGDIGLVNYDLIQSGQKSLQYKVNNTSDLLTGAGSPTSSSFAYIAYQYAIDVRLGQF